MNVAFLILVHKQIELTYKQIDSLDANNHFFFIHIDRKYKVSIKKNYEQRKNVVFIKDRFKVYWGGFRIIEATLSLINFAYHSNINFDYFILMSGQCYAIKSNKSIDNFLIKNKGKNFIEVNNLLKTSTNKLDKYYYPVFFDKFGFLSLINFNYNNKNFNLNKFFMKIIKKIYKSLNIKRNIPKTITPCFGSQWWILHKHAIKYILDFSNNHNDIVSFFRHTWAPDELFFQTILFSSDFHNSIINNSLWYIDWKTNGPPKVLTTYDYNKIINSKKLFARKFDLELSYKLITKIDASFNL